MKVVSSKVLPYEVLLDRLIAVNTEDKFIRSIDKWTAHSNQYITSQHMLPHRAFSIFLFNSQNKLLMQKRSAEKKTFPLCWTNTCCSHPNMVKMENGQQQEEPIRESLHRALHRELRMNLRESPFFFMNKVLYHQPGFNGQNDFGEFEMDYVYINKLATETVSFDMVPSQVCETKWISKKELEPFISETIAKGGYFSPWFHIMTKSGILYKWWDLVEAGTLRNLEDVEKSKVINCLQFQYETPK